eukprot:TRINITY_DN15994_c0_g1_i1.p1 TRINITY_DN15994_c0_g1~~TRINITY_DN15994_c0_g1_i1.p1  ORF type:complete len:219 (+),score=67.07 TRINITY_DN15994_c0_g1_i1:45-659(+)
MSEADSAGDVIVEMELEDMAADHEEGGTGLDQRTFIQRLVDHAPRILVSRQYYHFCLIMILLNLAMLLWVLINQGDFPSSPVFVVTETFVTVAFIGEIVLKYVAMGHSFWTWWWNRLDILVLTMWLIALVWYYYVHEIVGLDDFTQGVGIDGGWPEALMDVLASTALPLRYLSQLLRLFIFLKNRRVKVWNDEGEVSFEALEDA